MPIYEYRCSGCGKISEILHKSYNTGEVVCPECGSKGMEKLISTPATPVIKSGASDARPCGKEGCGPKTCDAPGSCCGHG